MLRVKGGGSRRQKPTAAATNVTGARLYSWAPVIKRLGDNTPNDAGDYARQNSTSNKLRSSSDVAGLRE